MAEVEAKMASFTGLINSHVMEPADFHLAQVNIAHLIEPMDSERLASFVAALDPVNATADAAPGFVWRLKTEDGNATSFKAFEWDLDGSAGVITNMSVWESFEALKDFVYSPTHLEALRQKRNWFHKAAGATTALWWIPTEYVPTLEDAESRIRTIREHGPTLEAFDLSKKFSPKN